MKRSESIIEMEAPRTQSITGFQSAVSALLFVLIAATALAVDFLARSATVAQWFNQRGMKEAVESHGNYDERGQFFDEIDYLWLVKVQRGDYSDGGVAIIGSSIAHSALRDWAFPKEQRALVHNYGYNGANLANCADFLRYLIKYRALVAAGPRKTLVILGLHYIDIGNSPNNKRVFDASILRSGLYNYDSRNGITPVALNPVERWIKFEEMRCRSFLMAAADVLNPAPPKINPKMYRRVMIDRLGPNWPEMLATQSSAESTLLDELKAQGVNVIGVLLPRGSWTEGEAAEAFSQEMKRIFGDRQIPLLDYSRSVPDAGFMDTVHYSFQGEEITDGLLMKIAVDFLHGTGALPGTSVFQSPQIPSVN